MNESPSYPHIPADSSSPFPLALSLAEEAARNEMEALGHFFLFQQPLATLLQAAVRDGLALLVLKGAALAQTVYPRPGLRQFGDLDVLVRPDEAQRARALLESLGYIVDTAQWEELACGRDGQANFFQHAPRGSLVVELHTDLVNNDLFWQRYRLDYKGMWQRAQEVLLAGVPGRVLGPEDQLLHLCLHLAGHYLAAPQSLRDIDQVCRVHPIDWPFFVTLARCSGAASASFAGLFTAASLLGVSVPAFVLDQLAPRRGRRLLERYAAERGADVEQAYTEHLRFPLLWLLLETWPARLSALVHTVFPSRHWLIMHYYHGLYDSPEVPAFLRGPSGSPTLTLRQSLRRFGVLLALYLAHFRFLLRALYSFLARVPAHLRLQRPSARSVGKERQ